MEKSGKLNRNLSQTECPWLSKDLEKGKRVWEYLNYTYNCIGPGGIAVSDEPNENPFYQVPQDSVDWDK